MIIFFRNGDGRYTLRLQATAAMAVVGRYNKHTITTAGQMLSSNSEASLTFVVTRLRNISTAMTASPNR